jgi:hypothetical protein
LLYVITYQRIDAFPADYDTSPMDMAVERGLSWLRFDREKVRIIFGGFRQKMAAEFWIVPEGAEPPKPSDTLPKPAIPTDKTFIFAKRYLVPPMADEPLEFLSVSARKARIKWEKEFEEEYKKEFAHHTKEELEYLKFYWVVDSFGEMLKSREDSAGTIIFYADYQHYSIKNIRQIIEEGKIRIANETKILPARIKVLFGGYRPMPEAEFWVIPKNGKLPKATPEKKEF